MSWRAGGDGKGIQIPAEIWERVFGPKPDPDPDPEPSLADLIEPLFTPEQRPSVRKVISDMKLDDPGPEFKARAQKALDEHERRKAEYEAYMRGDHMCPGCDLHEGPQPLKIHPD